MNSRARSHRSRQLHRQSLQILPGGVNSPVRAFRAVGGNPVFIARARGAYLFDVDGNRYLDYVGSWGPAIVGHAHPRVVRKVREAAAAGLSFGAATERELLLARLIRSAFPAMEKLRLVNSGTEAAMSAVRLARAYTGRTRIVKFDGCYHGHSDSFLVKAGSGSMTFGIADSAGVTPRVAQDTISIPFNDAESVEKTFQQNGKNIAALIVEPVAANMGLVLPEPGFLRLLREVTSHYGSLLIFDEVISGFRVCFGGAQHWYGVTPDLTCLGKIVGGGLPIGAYGGRDEIMELVAPLGPVYQAGTLSGNPLATAAGIETLTILSQAQGAYEKIENITATLCKGMGEIISRRGVSARIAQLGSLFTLFFSGKQVKDYRQANRCDLKAFARYFRAMLKGGIYIPPSQFETNFVSMAHTRKDIAMTLEVVDRALGLVRKV
jgi:glutamate-1-semialdehyde 2,1-aminomutase